MKKLLMVLVLLLVFPSAYAEKDKPDDTFKDRVVKLEAQVAALEALLTNVTRGSDPNTGYDTIQFSDMNVQIVNGTGTTEGTTTGTGNLIIGYNELYGLGDDRSGSHNLVIGMFNNYTADSYGGMVVGVANKISGQYSSVSGGRDNIASGYASSVSGGGVNLASGYASSVSGGGGNHAGGQQYSSVSGGVSNLASGWFSSVSGGTDNLASGWYSAVSGGDRRSATGENDWVAGSLFEDN